MLLIYCFRPSMEWTVAELCFGDDWGKAHVVLARRLSTEG